VIALGVGKVDTVGVVLPFTVSVPGAKVKV